MVDTEINKGAKYSNDYFLITSFITWLVRLLPGEKENDLRYRFSVVLITFPFFGLVIPGAIWIITGFNLYHHPTAYIAMIWLVIAPILIDFFEYSIDNFKGEFRKLLKEPVWLFNLKLDSPQHLKAGPIANELKMKFNEEKRKLPSSAQISKRDKEWVVIIDGIEKYRIEDTGSELRIFGPATELINKIVYVHREGDSSKPKKLRKLNKDERLKDTRFHIGVRALAIEIILFFMLPYLLPRCDYFSLTHYLLALAFIPGIIMLTIVLYLIYQIIFQFSDLCVPENVKPLDPFHEDGFGGLSVMGNFSISVTVLLSSFGLFIPYIFFRVQADPGWLQYLPLCALAFIVMLILITFSIPIIYINKLATAKKREIIEPLRERLKPIRKEMEKETNLSPEFINEARIRLQYYEKVSAMKVWPFDKHTLIALIGSIILPIITTALSYFMKYFMKYSYGL